MAGSIEKPLFLNGEEVEQYLPLDELIDKIENSFVQFSNKAEGLVQPQRLFLPIYDDNFYIVKPACSLSDKTLSTKLLTIYPNNEKRYGLPNLQSIVTISDSDTGAFQAVMDGISVTDLRTAAASAVAVRHLCPDGNTVAIIGSGHQGISHIKVLRALKKFEEIRVFCRSPEKRDEFAKQWEVTTSFNSVEETVRAADIVITATSSKSAVLFHKWVKKNALVIIVGAPEPTSREVDDDLMHKSQVISDSFVAAQACGDVKLSGAVVHGELGDVISGKVNPQWDRIRVFKSNGMAIQDLVAGRIVVSNYNKANK